MSEEKTFTQEEVNSIVKGRLADIEKKNEVYINSLKDEHQQEISGLNDKLSALTDENGQLKDKALKVDELQSKLTETEGKVAEFTAKEEQALFNSKLTEKGVKQERLEAFSKLLGDDKSDEAIQGLIEQFPEWMTPSEGEQQKPRLVTEGNPVPTESKEVDPFQAKLAKYQ